LFSFKKILKSIVFKRKKKMADISNKLAKIGEANRTKDKPNQEFKNTTKKPLKSSKEQHVGGKRKAPFVEVKERLKTLSDDVKKYRERFAQRKNDEKAESKTSPTLCAKINKQVLERAKEHNSANNAESKNQIDRLRAQKIEKARIIEDKLYTAQQRRERELERQIAKYRKFVRRVAAQQHEAVPGAAKAA